MKKLLKTAHDFAFDRWQAELKKAVSEARIEERQTAIEKAKIAAK